MNSFLLSSKVILFFVLGLFVLHTDIYAQCMEGDCTTGFGKIRYESGGVYEGNFDLGKPSGKGSFTGPQYKYNGEYAEGKFNGIGVYENDKLKYEGFFKNNKFEGGGKLIFFDGESYIGNFKNNLKHGLGRYTFQDSSYYDGEWVDDKMNGKGTMYLKGKYKLQGKWIDGEMEGSGFSYYESGDNYEGEFKKSIPHGYGTLYLKNGGKMVGEWNDGQYVSGLDTKNTTTFSNAPNAVRITENDGVLQIPVKINNTDADFIISTASPTTLLSKNFVISLIKNKIITESDIVNSKSFYNEKGELDDRIKLKIKELKIANASIQNVIAGIYSKPSDTEFPTIREPLILGQNVLREIGKVQIDYLSRLFYVLK